MIFVSIGEVEFNNSESKCFVLERYQRYREVDMNHDNDNDDDNDNDNDNGSDNDNDDAASVLGNCIHTSHPIRFLLGNLVCNQNLQIS